MGLCPLFLPVSVLATAGLLWSCFVLFVTKLVIEKFSEVKKVEEQKTLKNKSFFYFYFKIYYVHLKLRESRLGDYAIIKIK